MELELSENQSLEQTVFSSEALGFGWTILICCPQWHSSGIKDGGADLAESFVDIKGSLGW